jgi:hypothetical protein
MRVVCVYSSTFARVRSSPICKHMDHWQQLRDNQKIAVTDNTERYLCFSRCRSLHLYRKTLHNVHIQRDCDFKVFLETKMNVID